jgi:Anticodon binding domain
MISESPTESSLATESRFSASDVAAILRERGWLDAGATSGAEAAARKNAFPAGPKPCAGEITFRSADHAKQELESWLREAALLLGPHCAERDALTGLLRLVFEYDAQDILRSPESHRVLAREGAREVIRELAHLVLEGPEMDSDRFKRIILALKTRLRFRGRELFHPIRLALAGRAGEGELDRVILLLDPGARLPFRAPAKSNRQRMLDFCAALD